MSNLRIRLPIAILYPVSKEYYEIRCGGSLISELFVLTAAHCKTPGEVPPKIVRFGGVNQYDVTIHSLEIPIAEFIPHENYNAETRQNDIALIRLQYMIPDMLEPRPACLYQEDVGSMSVYATGWGKPFRVT